MENSSSDRPSLAGAGQPGRPTGEELDTLVAHLFSAILSETRPSRTYAEVSAVFHAQNYVKESLGCDGFWAHSAEQHADTDRARIGLIVTAIENALHAAESEHFGLSRKS